MTSEELASLREHHYRRRPELKVQTEEEALAYIQECGFLLLFAAEGMELPDLHQASTRPGEDWPWGCWQWKETLPGAKKCAYGKYLRHKGTFISWEYFSYFLAAYASPNGYIQDYREGRLTRVEREILEILEDRGPLLTRQLRKAVGLPGRKGTREFHRALEHLQAGFRITVAGGQLTGWSMHRWELVDNWVPADILKEGWRLNREEARKVILARYLDTVVAAKLEGMARVFSWGEEAVQEAMEALDAEGQVAMDVEIRGLKGKWVVKA